MMLEKRPFPVLTAEEAVLQIKDGDAVAFSGFTPAGAAKAVPKALAKLALQEHTLGQPFKLRILTGASSGQEIDEDLARAEAVVWRGPYQASQSIRQQINRQQVEYVDMHLSHVPQAIAFGFFGRVNFTVVEATEITSDGRVYLSTSIGASPTYLRYADKVIVEINQRQSPRLREMADIFVMPPPPHRNAIPVFDPLTRIGWPYATVDPQKVMGIVYSDEPDRVADFTPPDEESRRIARHVVDFLLEEKRAGRIPPDFLPLQAGVGNVANAVIGAIGEHPDIPPFKM